MTQRALASSSLGLIAGALFLSGCARCPYQQRCNGDVLEVCSLGVDQLVGPPSYGKSKCESPNPVCKDTSAGEAECVMPEAPTCDSGVAPRCVAGELAVHCVSGYQVATDCAADDNACIEVSGNALCARGPPTACDPKTYRNTCEDAGHLLYCRNALVTRQACDHERAGTTCVAHVPRDAFEQTAYCQPR